jgi:hypothetical protein
MKVIIAGSRSIKCSTDVLDNIIFRSPFYGKISEVLSGGALGIDSAGSKWAAFKGIPWKLFDPDWSRGHHAGILRNCAMAKYAGPAPEGGLVAIWDSKSPGTRHMIIDAQAVGLATFVWLWA